MKLKALWKSSPRKVLTGIGALLLATAVAVGSGANFNSSSANPGNIVTAGTVSQSNSKANAVIMSVSGMAPGATQNGTVDIRNTGDVASTFTLSKSNLSDTPSSPAFSGKLDLKVEDLGDPSCASGCPAPVTKYTGKVSAMGPISLGSFAVNGVHRYKFTVTFPDGGQGGADNAYKGARTSVDYAWESVSS